MGKSKIEEIQKTKSPHVVVDWLSARKKLDNETISCEDLDHTTTTISETECLNEDDTESFLDTYFESFDSRNLIEGIQNVGVQGNKYFMTSNEIVNMQKAIHTVRQKQASAELKRFQVLKHIVSKKYSREYKFSIRMGQVARQMENYFGNDKNNVKRMISLTNENENKCSELYAVNAIDTF